MSTQYYLLDYLMPQQHSNSWTTFLKLSIFATVYLDDILVFSKKELDHAEHLHWVLTKLCEHKLKAKHKKSAFGLAELQYLGHIIKNLNDIYGSVKSQCD